MHHFLRISEIWNREAVRGTIVQLERASAESESFVTVLSHDQMQQAPVLEIQRNLDERVKQLVQVYGHQGGELLADATQRISRRLGPQRTAEALKAIEQRGWSQACRAMLDYYDRCYDHELQRSAGRISIDLSGQDPDQAADKLIQLGHVEAD